MRSYTAYIAFVANIERGGCPWLAEGCESPRRLVRTHPVGAAEAMVIAGWLTDNVIVNRVAAVAASRTLGECPFVDAGVAIVRSVNDVVVVFFDLAQEC